MSLGGNGNFVSAERKSRTRFSTVITRSSKEIARRYRGNNGLSRFFYEFLERSLLYGTLDKKGSSGLSWTSLLVNMCPKRRTSICSVDRRVVRRGTNILVVTTVSVDFSTSFWNDSCCMERWTRKAAVESPWRTTVPPYSFLLDVIAGEHVSEKTHVYM
jgi:hypothetical protein